jgi:glutamate-1-semialdehyde 2,1-aminomutase
MAAGLAQLRVLKDTPDFYGKLNGVGDRFFGELKQLAGQAQIPCQVNHVGSLGCLFFTEQPVYDYASAQTSDTVRYTAYFRHMMDRGILLAPSQFEAVFLSSAHSDADLDRTLEAVRDFFR